MDENEQSRETIKEKSETRKRETAIVGAKKKAYDQETLPPSLISIPYSDLPCSPPHALWTRVSAGNSHARGHGLISILITVGIVFSMA